MEKKNSSASTSTTINPRNDPNSKSQQMRDLHEQGMSIADIARELQTYYSFVHRVIKRYEAEKANPKTKKLPVAQQIRQLCDEGKTVDQIHEILNVDKARIYSTMKKHKASKKGG